jgi:hypothetical protein
MGLIAERIEINTIKNKLAPILHDLNEKKNISDEVSALIPSSTYHNHNIQHSYVRCGLDDETVQLKWIKPKPQKPQHDLLRH